MSYQPPAAEIPHLLEWHASYCVTLAESSTHARTKRLLRLLAVDLAVEAQKHRNRRGAERGAEAHFTLDVSRDLALLS